MFLWVHMLCLLRRILRLLIFQSFSLHLSLCIFLWAHRFWYLVLFFLHCTLQHCRILIPQPGIETHFLCNESTNSFLFYFLIFTLFYFTILYWFCHTLTWIHHRCTCVPKHEPPSHLPPHNISLGHPRAPAPSMLYPASDIDWRFNSYMIVYLLQCHSPKSSHPLPLPLSPKVRYTHLCPFCCLAYRVVIAIFLNSIYMC